MEKVSASSSQAVTQGEAIKQPTKKYSIDPDIWDKVAIKTILGIAKLFKKEVTECSSLSKDALVHGKVVSFTYTMPDEKTGEAVESTISMRPSKMFEIVYEDLEVKLKTLNPTQRIVFAYILEKVCSIAAEKWQNIIKIVAICEPELELITTFSTTTERDQTIKKLAHSRILKSSSYHMCKLLSEQEGGRVDGQFSPVFEAICHDKASGVLHMLSAAFEEEFAFNQQFGQGIQPLPQTEKKEAVREYKLKDPSKIPDDKTIKNSLKNPNEFFKKYADIIEGQVVRRETFLKTHLIPNIAERIKNLDEYYLFLFNRILNIVVIYLNTEGFDLFGMLMHVDPAFSTDDKNSGRQMLRSALLQSFVFKSLKEKLLLNGILYGLHREEFNIYTQDQLSAFVLKTKREIQKFSSPPIAGTVKLAVIGSIAAIPKSMIIEKYDIFLSELKRNYPTTNFIFLVVRDEKWDSYARSLMRVDTGALNKIQLTDDAEKVKSKYAAIKA